MCQTLADEFRQAAVNEYTVHERQNIKVWDCFSKNGAGEVYRCIFDASLKKSAKLWNWYFKAYQLSPGQSQHFTEALSKPWSKSPRAHTVWHGKKKEEFFILLCGNWKETLTTTLVVKCLVDSMPRYRSSSSPES